MKGRPNFSPKALGDALHFWLSAAALKLLPVKINEGSAQKPFLKLAYQCKEGLRVLFCKNIFLIRHPSNTCEPVQSALTWELKPPSTQSVRVGGR